MFRCAALLAFMLCRSVGAQESPLPLTVPTSQSESLHFRNLERVSIANSQIARARAVAHRYVIVTGAKVGQTTLRVWAGGKENVFHVRVIPPQLRERKLTFQGADGMLSIELEFLELDEATGSTLGIRWPESISFQGTATVLGTASVSGLNYSTVFSSAKGMLQSLVNEGWAKIIANPHLHVRLGEEGVFQAGGEIPVANAYESYGRSHRHVEWKPYGLTVKIRPQSADGFRISSDVVLEISELDGAQTTNGTPGLKKRRLETKIDSVEGETVVLSGLSRETSSETNEGIWGLRQIPILGVLFGATTVSSSRSEMLMAMTLSLKSKARSQERIESLYDRMGGEHGN